MPFSFERVASCIPDHPTAPLACSITSDLVRGFEYSGEIAAIHRHNLQIRWVSTVPSSAILNEAGRPSVLRI